MKTEISEELILLKLSSYQFRRIGRVQKPRLPGEKMSSNEMMVSDLVSEFLHA